MSRPWTSFRDVEINGVDRVRVTEYPLVVPCFISGTGVRPTSSLDVSSVNSQSMFIRWVVGVTRKI